MLIPSPRHSPEDLAAWEAAERNDARRWLGERRRLERMADRAREAIAAFAAAGPCYVGVSWGKDSVVLAHLVRQVSPIMPLCWVITPKWETPECWEVRDRFLAAWPGAYREYADHELPVVERDGMLVAVVDDAEAWPPARDFGPRYISGIRGDESAARRWRMRGHGVATARTCAPLGAWRADDVFAWLHGHGLPVHPAYACSRGGTLDRGRLRVAPLGGDRGTWAGRREWERHYYGEELAALGL